MAVGIRIGRTDGRKLPTADQLRHCLAVQRPKLPADLAERCIAGWLALEGRDRDGSLIEHTLPHFLRYCDGAWAKARREE